MQAPIELLSVLVIIALTAAAVAPVCLLVFFAIDWRKERLW